MIGGIATRSVCSALCVLWALSGSARAEPNIAFGAAIPGQSIEQIVDAMPGAEWRFFHDASNQALVGAIASDAVEFADRRWTLRLGATNSTDSAYAYSFELVHSGRYEREEQCAAELSNAVAALEPSLGDFEPGSLADIHPSYAATAGAEPAVMSIGTVSSAHRFSRARTRYRDRGYDIVGIRNEQMGAATSVRVSAVNTRDRYDGPRSEYTLVVGYLCFVTIAFKAPAGR
ncbi:MAG: hypothetical protein NT015_01100 [Alphaproteobacteria bacterium]|nr:hypothetical protein [Alphaproteobacteria bacterium]